MTIEEFVVLSKDIVCDYYRGHNNTNDGVEVLTPKNVCVVSAEETLIGNYNSFAVINSVPDDRVYEAYHDTLKNETYLHVYQRVDRICVKHKL